ncbi:hypothetical protein AB0G02_39500 [Actinosynnema sp. NPDC023658]|uniref:hypothetical protein n=1 Tax=Actinosynnema sp. NPDC023658 TaxID=3155465 RepID=UPI0033E794CC
MSGHKIVADRQTMFRSALPLHGQLGSPMHDNDAVSEHQNCVTGPSYQPVVQARDIHGGVQVPSVGGPVAGRADERPLRSPDRVMGCTLLVRDKHITRRLTPSGLHGK